MGILLPHRGSGGDDERERDLDGDCAAAADRPPKATGRAAAAQILTLNGRVSWPFFVLAGIVVVALALRLHGVNWDEGFGFHPDERDIYLRSDCMYRLLADEPGAKTCGYLIEQPDAEPGLDGLRYFFDPGRSPLNPHWFPLGSILIYVMVFFRSAVELFANLDGMEMRYAGRVLSALADVGSVLLVFALGRRLYGRNVGLLAAGLTALAVIHIQHSHFYRPETFTVLLTLASIWATLRMVEQRRLRDSALLGLILGLALSPKVNVLPLLAPLALGYAYRLLDEADGRWSGITPEMAQKIAGHALMAGAVALAVFFITTPYAFIDVGAFIADVMTQTRMARNAGLWPFTTQYVDTPPFLYQIRQTIVWGMGLPLGIMAWLSIPFTAALVLLDRRHIRADLMLLAWVVPSLLFLESFEVRFLRYIFPLIPVMILLAARMMLWGVEQARGWSSAALLPPYIRKGGLGKAALIAAVALPVAVTAATAFYSLAFQRVYAAEHPAMAAARWALAEIPRGSAIVMDNHWDEFVPGLYDYDVWQFPLYEADTRWKMRTLAWRLARSGYLMFYSHRPYTSAARDPERFPYSGNYYRLLFSGELGYRLHREFTAYPSLAGIEFRDDALARAGLNRPAPEIPRPDPALSLNLGYADDNVAGYDHPTVLVFRNAERLDAARLREMLVNPPRTSPCRGRQPGRTDVIARGVGETTGRRHLRRYYRPGRLDRPGAGFGLAADRGADLSAGLAVGLFRIPPLARPGDSTGADPGVAGSVLCSLDLGFAGLGRLFPRRGVPRDGRVGGSVGRGVVVRAAGVMAVCAGAMAAAGFQRGFVSSGIPRLCAGALYQPRLVASLPGRRKADGAGVSYRRLSLYHAAAFRPVVRRGVSELLLLGLLCGRLADAGDGHCANHRL